MMPLHSIGTLPKRGSVTEHIYAHEHIQVSTRVGGASQWLISDSRKREYGSSPAWASVRVHMCGSCATRSLSGTLWSGDLHYLKEIARGGHSGTAGPFGQVPRPCGGREAQDLGAGIFSSHTGVQG